MNNALLLSVWSILKFKQKTDLGISNAHIVLYPVLSFSPIPSFLQFLEV